MKKRINLFFLLTIPLFQFTNAQIDLNRGLVAYYPFNGNALDATGRGNNPSFNNATLATDRNGVVNSAYSFNGFNQYIQIPNKIDFNQDSSMTISFQFLTKTTNLQNILEKFNIPVQQPHNLIVGLILAIFLACIME